MRSPDSKDRSINHEELIKSTIQDIVTEELRKIKETPLTSCSGTMIPELETSDDMLWEYDGPHSAYQGECEEIYLEMQKIFYEDLKSEEIGKDGYITVPEDEEDEYLVRLVFENMHLNDDKVKKAVWCPICKKGELQQNHQHIDCSLCEFKLNGGDEVSLEFVRNRLAEVLEQHHNSGCPCPSKTKFSTVSGIVGLYMECQGCDTFDIVM